jgi:hypothetical protein
MKQVGWVTAGDTLGESALVNFNDKRLVTVVAGDGGCHLAVLERAVYNKLQNQHEEESCHVSEGGSITIERCWT